MGLICVLYRTVNKPLLEHSSINRTLQHLLLFSWGFTNAWAAGAFNAIKITCSTERFCNLSFSDDVSFYFFYQSLLLSTRASRDSTGSPHPLQLFLLKLSREGERERIPLSFCHDHCFCSFAETCVGTTSRVTVSWNGWWSGSTAPMPPWIRFIVKARPRSWTRISTTWNLSLSTASPQVEYQTYWLLPKGEGRGILFLSVGVCLPASLPK